MDVKAHSHSIFSVALALQETQHANTANINNNSGKHLNSKATTSFIVITASKLVT